MSAPTSPPRPVREIEHCWIPLADGCRLAARLWLPADAEAHPVPAVLEYIPYRKRDGTAERDEVTHPYLAAHGYACVRVDIRGNGESDGLMLDEYTRQELQDGVEVIAWIAAQPWCDGAVGMMGISWGGFNALQVAALRPPALKAIIPICFTDDRYADDIHYRGGCLLNDNLTWAATMMAFSSRPPDPLLVGEDWRRAWLERLEHMPQLAETWLRHQRRDAYWKHGSVCEDIAAVQVPVLAVGGWADAYSNAVPRLLRDLEVPVRALTGPWIHKYPNLSPLGPSIDFLAECRRWWDHWLKGIDSGVLDAPAYRAYLQESVPPAAFHDHRPGRWVSEPSWPSPNIERRRYVINATGLDSRAGPEEALTVCSPQTTGLAGGEFMPMSGGPVLATDQREDDAGSLVFDSAPLTERLEILGAPVVELELAVDRPQAFVVVRLCEVGPGGHSARITWAPLNLAHRDSHEHPEPLQPGRRYRVRITLNDIAHAFPAGSRLRVALSTAYWPLLWPSPEPVTLTLYSGASSLTLPERAARAESLREPEPAPALPPSAETLRDAQLSRTLERNVANGETWLRVTRDGGARRFPAHDLTVASLARETYRIRPQDPLSARTETHWTMTLQRGDWRVRTESRSAMWSDREYYHLQTDLDAYEGDRRVFCRSWCSSVPRDCN